MTTIRSGPDAMARAADIGIFDAPGARARDEIFKVLRRLWREILALPDRGAAATPDDVPSEFYRFPPF